MKLTLHFHLVSRWRMGSTVPQFCVCLYGIHGHNFPFIIHFFFGISVKISVFSRASYSIMSHINPIYILHTVSLRSILILSSSLYLCLASGPFPVNFPPKSCMHTSRSCHTLHPSYHLWFDHIIISAAQYQSWSFSLCSSLQCTIKSSNHSPNRGNFSVDFK